MKLVLHSANREFFEKLVRKTSSNGISLSTLWTYYRNRPVDYYRYRCRTRVLRSYLYCVLIAWLCIAFIPRLLARSAGDVLKTKTFFLSPHSLALGCLRLRRV